MACFVAPAAEAIVITILKKQQEKKEQQALQTGKPAVAENAIPWSRKLGWLHNMLWGGVFLLAIEHAWHGEIVPWPPFFTAMQNPAAIGPMFLEIATVGVGMAAFVTAVWYVGTLIVERRAKLLRAKLAELK